MVLSLNRHRPHSRKIIGYHFDRNMTTVIVEKALEDAVSNRNVENGLILHTDLGSQYTSNQYEERLKELTITIPTAVKAVPTITKDRIIPCIIEERTCVPTTNISNF